MNLRLSARATGTTLPLVALSEDGLQKWLSKAPKADAAWVKSQNFKAGAGETCAVPGKDGGVSKVLAGISALGTPDLIWDFAALANALPNGRYRLDSDMKPGDATSAALGWALAQYRFDRYTKKTRPEADLVWPKGADKSLVEAQAQSITLTRDLINTPACDMTPADLAEEAKKLAKAFKAKCQVIVGESLLKQNYPSVHAVGRASDVAPRLIDIKWGNAKDPKVTLVGKGVTFDSGGLDLKPASGMLMMKKDMGGSAQALGLARMIMETGMKVRLRVLIPAVENAVSGNSFHPWDVLDTRKGLTVEVGNTDAEGRLILSDALTAADQDKPEMILDFATLTGAARVALGTELPALFCNDDKLAAGILAAGEAVGDNMWRLPLWQSYKKGMKSKVADVSSTGSGPFGGAITAALFLEHFVSETTPWAHVDMSAWSYSERPGRPEGGDAMAIRAMYEMLSKRYG